MAPDYHADFVPLAELVGDVPSELHGVLPARRRVQAEVVLLVRVVVLDRVRPEGVEDEGVFVDLPVADWPREALHLVEVPLAGAYAAMQDEGLAPHQAAEGQHIERVMECVENPWPVGPVALVALVDEAVARVHGLVLVVPAEEPHPGGEEHLEREDEHGDADLVRSPVDEVTVEDKVAPVRLPGPAVLAEHEHDVAQLPVGVPEHDARGARLYQGGLGGEHVSRGSRQGFCLGRRHLHHVGTHMPVSIVDVPSAAVLLYQLL
mmetsp:Transcript_57593/g.162425  ORF Transcript_57593/g.162425 Transcript_57593/m.162425 type:complete len:263 (+) Transcript_57593:324-1112(+)